MREIKDFMNKKDIEAGRQLILEEFNKMKTPRSPYAVKKLINMYDELFFEGKLQDAKIVVEWSGRLTKSAGCLTSYRYRKNMPYTLKLSSKVLASSNFKESQEVNGLKANSWLEGTLLVLEHELIHLYETHLFGNTGHNWRFSFHANKIFGHTKSYHSIMVPRRRETHGASPAYKIAANKYKGQLDYQVGQLVSFETRGKTITGTIVRRGKDRASIVDGNVRWRVPYAFLREAKFKIGNVKVVEL